MLEGFLKPDPMKLLQMAQSYDPAPLEQMFAQMAVPNAQGQDMSNPMLQFGGQPTIPMPGAGANTTMPAQQPAAPLDAQQLALMSRMNPQPPAPHWAPAAAIPNQTRNIQFAPMILGQHANGVAPGVNLPNFAAILNGARR